MSNWDIGVVTDGGRAVLAKVEAGTASAELISMAIGSGVYSSGEIATLTRATALKSQKLSAGFTSKRFSAADTLVVKASFLNETISTDFNITECGVFIQVTEGGTTSNVLFAICLTSTPDVMSAYNGSYPQIVTNEFILPVSSESDITVEMSSVAYALATDLEALEAVVDKAYLTDDTAETALANNDCLPFYDTSAAKQKKMLLSTARNDVRKRIAESVNNDVMETIGGTAQKSYSIGQYFIGNDGYYYVATAAITAGSSTISTGVGGKCSKTSIAAGMNNLLSQISNLNTSIGKLNSTFTVIGGASITLATANGTTHTIKTLLTNAWNKFKSLDENSSEWGKSYPVRFRLVSLAIPYVEGQLNSMSLEIINPMITPRNNFNNVSSLALGRVSGLQNHMFHLAWCVWTGDSSQVMFYSQSTNALSTYNDYLYNKPAAGAIIQANFELFREQ